MSFDSILVILIIAGLAYFFVLSPSSKAAIISAPAAVTQPSATPTTMARPFNGTTLKIASWNLQVFGEAKASVGSLMDSYAEKMKPYDIIIVQEIRDSTGTAFKGLCDRMPGYSCVNSSRAGKTSSKEQYGFIYRNAVLVNLTDYNYGKYTAMFNRPPATANFRAGDWTFALTTIHTDPDDVRAELQALDGMFGARERTEEIIMGDLNADCDYYRTPPQEFLFWKWAVPDSEDTTVAATDCAYDRILLNPSARDNFIGYSIMRDVTPEQSDHYLVSATFALT